MNKRSKKVVLDRAESRQRNNERDKSVKMMQKVGIQVVFVGFWELNILCLTLANEQAEEPSWPNQHAHASVLSIRTETEPSRLDSTRIAPLTMAMMMMMTCRASSNRQTYITSSLASQRRISDEQSFESRQQQAEPWSVLLQAAVEPDPSSQVPLKATFLSLQANKLAKWFEKCKSSN